MTWAPELSNPSLDTGVIDKIKPGKIVVPEFKNFVMPLIRKVDPNWVRLIAADLVSVQPMAGDVGMIFFQRYRYGAAPIIIVKRTIPNVFGQIGVRILEEPDERQEPEIWVPEPEPPRKTIIFVPSNFGTFPVRHLEA